MSSAAVMLRGLAIMQCAALMLTFPTHEGSAQGKVRIWDVALGTHVDKLPSDFMLAACGTNGGPPSTFLDGFDEFAKCRAEPETGLHEVWFSYDDEAEYVNRALRSPPPLLARSVANQLFNHPVIFSLLIDSAGRVQGYRIVSDPREDPTARIDADIVALPLRNEVFGFEGWTCTELPRSEGERPLGGRFVKESCEKITDGRRVTLETHAYLKAGQGISRLGRTPDPNEFDVSVRLGVINALLSQ